MLIGAQEARGYVPPASFFMAMLQRASCLVSLFLIVYQAGCGYHFIGAKSDYLAGIETVAVPYWANKSFEPGLERALTHAVVDEFVKSSILDVVSEDEADAVLRGAIASFREYIISYNEDDRALEYRIIAEVEVSLEERASGKTLWRNRSIFQTEEYETSSDITVTEANKDGAITKLAKDIAERVHDYVIEEF
jgi:outer membrane lipopolysaccharide assembly protein LptE/RlpB